MKFASALLALVLAFVTGISPAAQAAQAQPSGGVQVVNEEDACYLPLTDEQRGQLRSYVTDDPTTKGNGVCVLEPAQDGTYVQHYYSEQDSSSFADYFLYALLVRTCASSTLLTIGYISGDISLLEYILLSSWVNVDRYGYVFQPYQKNLSTGSWTRVRVELSKQVSKKQYGKAAPQMRLASQQSVTPPRGYATQKTSVSKGSAIVNSGTTTRRAEAPRSASVPRAATTVSKPSKR